MYDLSNVFLHGSVWINHLPNLRGGWEGGRQGHNTHTAGSLSCAWGVGRALVQVKSGALVPNTTVATTKATTTTGMSPDFVVASYHHNSHVARWFAVPHFLTQCFSQLFFPYSSLKSQSHCPESSLDPGMFMGRLGRLGPYKDSVVTDQWEKQSFWFPI